MIYVLITYYNMCQITYYSLIFRRSPSSLNSVVLQINVTHTHMFLRNFPTKNVVSSSLIKQLLNTYINSYLRTDEINVYDFSALPAIRRHFLQTNIFLFGFGNSFELVTIPNQTHT